MVGTLERKKELTRASNWYILTSIVLYLITVFISSTGGTTAGVSGGLPSWILLTAILVSIGLWFVGLRYYAFSKGYSGAWSALGLLSIFGLIILVLMPNKFIVRAQPVVDPNSNYPRPDLE